MLVPAFHLHLNEKIQRSQATIGKFDGQHPCLTCATVAGKIFLHNPHQHGLSESHITYLNINKQITALVAGCLNPKSGKDVLLVGTKGSLQCYDVDQNKDLFFKDVTDGVNVVLVGQFGSQDKPLALVGGNCTVQGFDGDGKEKFWTVTGDNVSAMALCDVDGDGRRELLVGSDDFDIRVFQSENMLAEVSEADQLVALCPVHLSRFGYGLVNGTIGVYDRLDRIWRVKSKHSVCAIGAFDLDGDGVPEMISGWSNGRVEVRREDSGEVVYRDHLTCQVSSILTADYRNDGQQEVVVCGLEGEVRGYLPVDPRAGVVDEDFSMQQSAIADLTQRKQELLYELTSYQNTRSSMVQAGASSNLIPPDTRVESFLTMNHVASSFDLVLKTNNDTTIRGVVLFGEQIFPEESLFVFPKVPHTQLAVPLRPLKDTNVVLMIKVLVGSRSSTAYHIFELEIELPKFAMYASVEKGSIPEPESQVTFTLPERIPRIVSWIEARFNIKQTALRSDTVEAQFVCLRDRKPLCIRASPINNMVQVVIKTDSMDMAGDIVSDMVQFFGITDLSSTADFPKAMADFKGVLGKMEEHNDTRMRMNADMADSSNLVKQLLIKAEDVRILGDMKNMRRAYKKLFDLNKDLIVEHDKRATNHSSLMDSLKEVNLMIQRAARLRAGAPKSRIVNACRTAIKANNTSLILKIIKDGDDQGSKA